MTALLKSKAGIVLMVGLVCGVFFLLSKLKHRRAERAQPTAFSAAPDRGGMEQAVLLKRAQENARNRAEAVQLEKEKARQTGSSYDQDGDAFKRRATPEPIERHLRVENDHEARDQALEPRVVPALRIHGRKTPSPEGPLSALKNPLSSLLPDSFGGISPPPGFNSKAAPTAQLRAKPERFVPFGRLIKAELVITLESTQDEMPLVGLIVDPVYNNGRLVIPAGTELHSTARPDRIRDRIVSGTTWRMVFPREGEKPNGRQITFEGMALDREDRDGNGLTWGLTDGSYGLVGRSMKGTQTSDELMLFAAEALRAMSSTFTDRRETVVGAELRENARNAGVVGGQAVLEQFASRIFKEIERNGVYIQVPAGKQFYVYPRQVIDPDRADIPENIAEVE